MVLRGWKRFINLIRTTTRLLKPRRKKKVLVATAVPVSPVPVLPNTQIDAIAVMPFIEETADAPIEVASDPLEDIPIPPPPPAPGVWAMELGGHRK